MHKIEVQKVAAGQESESYVFRAFARRADEVAQRAFELFEKRGGADGLAIEDWLQAEQQILGVATAELSEDESTYQIRVALTGFKPDQMQVAASEREIVVHASICESAIQEELFKRFQLPMSLDAGKVSAALSKGMLQIIAPKAGLPVATAATVRASGTCDPKCKNGCASASSKRPVLVPLMS